MGRAFYLPLPATPKLVLLAMLDHANDDGTDMFAGQERIAQKAGCSDRTVRRIVDQFVTDGLLIPEARRGSRGTNRYRLNLERLGDVDRTIAGRPAKLADRPPACPVEPHVDRTNRTVDRTQLCPTNHQGEPSGKEQPSGGKRGEVEAFVDDYHRLCPMLPRCLALTTKRRRQIAARLHERPREEWQRILTLLAASRFHTGENDRGWRADIDWLIRNAENGLKLLERGAPAPVRPVALAAGGVRMRTVEETNARIALIQAQQARMAEARR